MQPVLFKQHLMHIKLSLTGYLLVFTFLTQAQTTLNSSYFQVMSARALGPSTMSGRITAIEGITADGQVNLYVGTAGGGIWKSQNGGQSFTPLFDKYCQSCMQEPVKVICVILFLSVMAYIKPQMVATTGRN
jgi:hypothetical protein